MNIVTRAVAIQNLRKHLGIDLASFAKEYGITMYETGKQNKGWKGLVLERLSGLTNNNSKAPNGLSYELKSVSFSMQKGKLKPKETMAITMLNPEELVRDDFFHSHCWAKLKSIVFCAVMWHGRDSERSELLQVTSMDFNESEELIMGIKADYDLIREKLITKGFDSLTGKDGVWIQARTKGPGHGSVSRAFYAKKNLVEKIFETSMALCEFHEDK